MNTVANGDIRIPEWVQGVLVGFEQKAEPHNLVAIVDILDRIRQSQGDLNDDDWKGYIAERSAFFFMERPDEDSVWETYFAPMMTITQNDGSELRAPDIKDLDAATVAHWEKRAKSVQNPEMRARYADLVWDLGRVIVQANRKYEYAQIAIDAYLEATERKLYPMEIVAIQWLRRALDLSRHQR